MWQCKANLKNIISVIYSYMENVDNSIYNFLCHHISLLTPIQNFEICFMTICMAIFTNIAVRIIGYAYGNALPPHGAAPLG